MILNLIQVGEPAEPKWRPNAARHCEERSDEAIQDASAFRASQLAGTPAFAHRASAALAHLPNRYRGQFLVTAHVILRHAPRGKAPFELRAHAATVELFQA